MDEGVRIGALDLESYQGSAGSEAPFKREALVLPLVSISVCSLCWLVTLMVLLTECSLENSLEVT